MTVTQPPDDFTAARYLRETEQDIRRHLRECGADALAEAAISAAVMRSCRSHLPLAVLTRQFATPQAVEAVKGVQRAYAGLQGDLLLAYTAMYVEGVPLPGEPSPTTPGTRPTLCRVK